MKSVENVGYGSLHSLNFIIWACPICYFCKLLCQIFIVSGFLIVVLPVAVDEVWCHRTHGGICVVLKPDLP